jgi:hypothetical protein
MNESDINLRIVEAVLGLDDPDQHEELIRWITEDARRRDLYLYWARILDEAFPPDPAAFECGIEPPDVLAAIEDRIDKDPTS